MPSRRRDHVSAGHAQRVVRAQTEGPSLRSGVSRAGRVRVAEMQRARLLGGAVAAVEELGWGGVSVASIASRARVSRKTFYDLFADRDACLLEVLRDTGMLVQSELAAADLGERSWRERVRIGLWMILCFLEREPELARLCVVQSAFGGPVVARWRGEMLARLTGLVDEGRLQGVGAARVPGLTAEGVVGGVSAIVAKRIAYEESLIDLLNPLMAMIVLPYLGAKAARSEHEHALPGPVATKPGQRGERAQRRVYEPGRDPLKDVPMRLTYRTAMVLAAVARHPGASNRVIGEHSEIPDQGQISKLLARLRGLGLLQNTAAPDARSQGAANAWSLTELGKRITEQLSLNNDRPEDGGA